MAVKQKGPVNWEATVADDPFVYYSSVYVVGSWITYNVSYMGRQINEILKVVPLLLMKSYRVFFQNSLADVPALLCGLYGFKVPGAHDENMESADSKAISLTTNYCIQFGEFG